VLASFANFPLTGIHAHAADAAIAADCAYRQRKFWPLHDAIFRRTTPRLDVTELARHAQSVGLDMPTFESCFRDDRRDERIEVFIRSAREIGATGTPTFLIGLRSGQQVRPVKRLDGGAGVDVISRELDALVRKS
jgi:protein-disulfide isomerase